MQSRHSFFAAFAASALFAACTSSAPTAGPSTSATARRSSKPVTPAAARCTVEPWTLPEAVSRAVVLGARGGLIVAGGLTASGSSTSRILQIDPSSGRLTNFGTLAVATHDAGGALFGSVVYVFGGGESKTTNLVQRFGGNGPAKAGTLPQPRSDLSVAIVGSHAVIVGGYDGARLLRGVLSTSDGTTFQNIASLQRPLRYVAVAAAGSVVYVLGGTSGSKDYPDIQAIDTSTGKAQIIGHLPQPLSHAVAVAWKGTVWVFGGRSGGAPVRSIYRFDPLNGRVSAAGRLPLALSDAGAAIVGGRAYIVGGESSSPHDTVIGCTLP